MEVQGVQPSPCTASLPASWSRVLWCPTWTLLLALTLEPVSHERSFVSCLCFCVQKTQGSCRPFHLPQNLLKQSTRIFWWWSFGLESLAPGVGKLGFRVPDGSATMVGRVHVRPWERLLSKLSEEVLGR